MLQLLALFAAVGFVNLLFVALQVVAFKVARFPVDQIGFGLPFLLKRRVNGVELEIGPVPTLAFVYSLAWKEASRGKRALTAVAPWLAIGCIPLAFFGPARGLSLELSMWPRLIQGALDSEHAHALLGALWQLRAPLSTCCSRCSGYGRRTAPARSSRPSVSYSGAL